MEYGKILPRVLEYFDFEFESDFNLQILHLFNANQRREDLL